MEDTANLSMEVNMRIIDRLAQEPAAVGTVVASVLPALVVLGLVSLDEQEIGVLVIAVNAVIGLAIRLLVTPATRPPAKRAQPDPAGG
jgi:hypothetical protein